MPNSNIHVLVVEDDLLMRRTAVALLTRLGCEVTAAANGLEALDFTGQDWDLVLMDCQMPVLDGLEATRQWRRRDTRRTPIVALTANTDAEEKERCLAAGMNDFVSKPLKPEILRQVLDKWVEARRQQGAANGDAGLDEEHRWDALLADYKGFEGELGGLVTAFLDELPATRHALASAIDAGNTAEAAQIAHKLKGSAMTLHADDVVQYTQEIDEATRHGDIEAMQRLARSLDSALEKLSTRLPALLGKLNSSSAH